MGNYRASRHSIKTQNQVMERGAAAAMAEQYGGARGGRLTFKGGEVAVRQSALKKKKKSKKAKSKPKGEAFEAFESADLPEDGAVVVPGDDDDAAGEGGGGGGEDIYTIDAAKRMKYDELSPVESPITLITRYIKISLK